MRAPTASERVLETRTLVAIAAVTAAFAVVYWQVFARLFDAWANDGNYSHGWLIVPLAAYFAWERRDRFFAAPVRSSWLGLVVILGSLLVLVAGLLGAELFLTRVSIVGSGSLRILAREALRSIGMARTNGLAVALRYEHSQDLAIQKAASVTLVVVDPARVYGGELKVERDGAANASQPIRSKADRTSSAAGSRR